MVPILESRGYFWWSDQSLDGDIKIPPTAVPGRLVIEEDGKSRLTLDGLLSDGLHSMFKQNDLRDTTLEKSIVGLLYGNGGYVCLLDHYITESQFSYNAPSREEIVASYCLRGSYPLLDVTFSPIVQGFHINLDNIDEWIRATNIKALDSLAEGTHIKQTFEYKRENIQYPIVGAILSMDFDIDSDFSHSKYFGVEKVSFAREVKLGYRANDHIGIKKVFDLTSRLQEFLALLMGVHVDLDWPHTFVESAESNQFGTLYFRRNRQAGKNLSISDLWTIFPGVRDSIGSLFDTFMLVREKFGPGVYLYLACLRTESMFAENRFTTLITGLESLYRRDGDLPQESNTEKERIDRILRDVQKEGDKTWLKKKLEYRAELTLEDRLNRLFEPLSNFMDADRLKAFTGQCAVLRNDVTHFGGLRGTTTYSELLERLGAFTPALASLYHALLLYRIGVSREIIGNAFNSSPVSWKIKRYMVQAGLREEEKATAQAFPPPNSSAQ